MTEHCVKLYALSTCSHCRSAKKLLGECNVVFEQIDVDLCTGEEREKIIAEVKAVNPNLSFPTLVIDGTVIVGFKEKDIREALD
jgi:glutaredoxin